MLDVPSSPTQTTLSDTMNGIWRCNQQYLRRHVMLGNALVPFCTLEQCLDEQPVAISAGVFRSTADTGNGWGSLLSVFLHLNGLLTMLLILSGGQDHSPFCCSRMTAVPEGPGTDCK